MKNTIFTKSIIILMVVFALAFATAAQESGEPVRKDRLMKVLQQKTLPIHNIISVIEKNGVDFVLTKEVEAELRALGAADDLIKAVRENYRGAEDESAEDEPFENPLPGQTMDESEVSPFPVKKEKLVQTLRAKEVEEYKMISVIKENGVDFRLTPIIESELRSAGASRKLMAAVRENFRILQKGIINGNAVSLPKPSYPSAARAVKAEGVVQVLVIVDEEGNVTDVRATSGHVLLREAAENAALNSKFKPTLLKGQKIKTAGFILYSFVP